MLRVRGVLSALGSGLAIGSFSCNFYGVPEPRTAEGSRVLCQRVSKFWSPFLGFRGFRVEDPL